MRLNWSNIGKGLEAIADAKMERDRKQGLAQESAKYNITEGAYGPELLQNIEQVKGLKQQAIAQGMEPAVAEQQYNPALEELLRRATLTEADYSMAQGPRDATGMPTNYASREAARQAAAPLRSEGLANIYRREGNIEEADKLEARALDQRRGEQQYQLGLKQGQLADYQIADAKTKADRVAGVTEAEKAASDYINKQAEKRGGFNNLTDEDFNVALQNQINTLRAKGYQTEANALVEGRDKRIRDRIATENAQYTQELGQVISSRNLDDFGRLYDKYVKDGARVVSVTKGPNDSIIVNRVLDNGDPTEPVTFKNFDELEARARALTKPEVMAQYSQQLFDNNLRSAAVETQKAQFAEQMGVRREEVTLAGQRLGVELARLEIAARDAQRKTLPGQIKELEDLGITLSDDDKKSLGGVKADADPLLKAELEVISSLAKNDVSGANKLDVFQQAAADALKRSSVRKKTKEIVTGLQRAEKAGKSPEAIAQLRGMGMSEAAIQSAAASAGVKYVPPPAPPRAGLGPDTVPPPPRPSTLGLRPQDNYNMPVAP